MRNEEDQYCYVENKVDLTQNNTHSVFYDFIKKQNTVQIKMKKNLGPNESNAVSYSRKTPILKQRRL